MAIKDSTKSTLFCSIIIHCGPLQKRPDIIKLLFHLYSYFDIVALLEFAKSMQILDPLQFFVFAYFLIAFVSQYIGQKPVHVLEVLVCSLRFITFG